MGTIAYETAKSQLPPIDPALEIKDGVQINAVSRHGSVGMPTLVARAQNLALV